MRLANGFIRLVYYHNWNGPVIKYNYQKQPNLTKTNQKSFTELWIQLSLTEIYYQPNPFIIKNYRILPRFTKTDGNRTNRDQT